MREVERKRHFRVGLNMFNSRPLLGLEYLAQRDFIELSPPAVARFLLECDGLSRDKVGKKADSDEKSKVLIYGGCFLSAIFVGELQNIFPRTRDRQILELLPF